MKRKSNETSQIMKENIKTNKQEQLSNNKTKYIYLSSKQNSKTRKNVNENKKALCESSKQQ